MPQWRQFEANIRHYRVLFLKYESTHCTRWSAGKLESAPLLQPALYSSVRSLLEKKKSCKYRQANKKLKKKKKSRSRPGNQCRTDTLYSPVLRSRTQSTCKLSARSLQQKLWCLKTTTAPAVSGGQTWCSPGEKQGIYTWEQQQELPRASYSRASESQLPVTLLIPKAPSDTQGNKCLCWGVAWALIWSAPEKFPLIHLLFQRTPSL